MWDLLNRVKAADWSVRIVGEKESHTSSTGISIDTHGRIEEVNDSDCVLFVSGYGVRERINDEGWLRRFNLDPEKQLIGSICSGSLILAKLGLLEGKTATTYPTSKALLQSFGIDVVEKPFVANGNVATAGGCLAQQYLIGWVIENLAGADWKNLVLKSIQPVGEGLFFDDIETLQPLYAPVTSGADVRQSGSEVTIRPATTRDAESISRMLLETFSAYSKNYAPDAAPILTPNSEQIKVILEEGPIWVAEIEGEIVGSVSLRTESEGLCIRSAAVRKDARGRGIWLKLLGAVNEYAEVCDTEANLVGHFYTELVYAGEKAVVRDGRIINPIAT
jgi:putative intracellular protease/amidase/N-acetylglutamate synthase-like GNAT family acetyltransferase